jgi:pimeloyl-ACP methyl ester carboxylesterase
MTTFLTMARYAAIGVAVLFVVSIVSAFVFVSVEIHRVQRIQSVDRYGSSPKSGIYVAAYDTRMFVQRSGPLSAPVVVFVPGTAAWSEMWRRYMDEVVGLGYQAVAIDLPPFGYSIPPRSGNYRKDVQGKRILAALDSLGVTQATFVAHSIGSAPLMEALLAEPGRVTKLVLVSPALGLDSPQSDGSETSVQHWLRKRWLGESLSACCLTNTRFTSALVKHFVAEKDKITDPWVELFKRGFYLSGTYQNVALWVPELVAPRGPLPSDSLDSYQHIRFPVVIIWGTADTITPMAQGNHLQALIPGSSLIQIPGGHVPMIEEPEKFGAALQRALADNQPSAAVSNLSQ